MGDEQPYHLVPFCSGIRRISIWYGNPVLTEAMADSDEEAIVYQPPVRPDDDPTVVVFSFRPGYQMQILAKWTRLMQRALRFAFNRRLRATQTNEFWTRRAHDWLPLPGTRRAAATAGQARPR